MSLNLTEKSKKHLIKNYRYKDSLGKYKQNPNLSIKNKLQINTNNTYDNLNRLDQGFINNTVYNLPKKNIMNFNPIQNYKRKVSNRKQKSLSPKHHHSSRTNQKRKLLLQKYKKKNNTSFFKPRNNFSNIIEFDNHNKSLIHLNLYHLKDLTSPNSYIFHNRNLNSYINTEKGRSGYISDKNDFYINKKNNISDDNIPRKLLDVISDLKQKNGQKVLQIKDLLNKKNRIKMANEKLLNDKNALLIKLEQVKKEYENFKNISLNELESKSYEISQLTNEIIKMRNLLEKEQNEFYSYNTNKNFPSKINIINNNDFLRKDYENNKRNEIDFNQYKKREIINNNNKLKTINKNLVIQINNIKQKNQNIIEQNQINEQMLNQNINSLNQLNIKYQNIISNLEREKNILSEAKKHYENNILELKEKILKSENENNLLKNELNTIKERMPLFIEEKNKLQEENTYLKTLQKSQNDIKSNSTYNDCIQENMNLKNLLEDTKRESEVLQIQLNGLSQNNKSLKKDKEELNKKISELENINKNLKSNLSGINEINTNSNNKNLQQQILILQREKQEKEEEIENLKNQIQNNIFVNNDGDNNNKNNKINQIDNENKNNINYKLLLENKQLKEKIQLLQAGQDENLINIIDNLKKELNDTKKQLNNLIKENKNIFNNENGEEDAKEIDFKNTNNPFRHTMNSQELDDPEKIKLYQEKLIEIKQINESDRLQINVLKEEIKKSKDKIKYLETFGGQIKDMHEFVKFLNLILINCKLKKDQKNILDKIITALNNYNPK